MTSDFGSQAYISSVLTHEIKSDSRNLDGKQQFLGQ